MTPKERSAMQQALIYLDAIINGEGVKPYQLEGTAFTLREALANSLKPKCFADYQPNHTIDRACASCAVAVECQTGEQAEQEPVGWYSHKGGFNECGEGQPLYAAPVRTKDLTDDEILDVALSIEIEFSKDTDRFVQQLEDIEVFARAVIEKFKEKNK